MTRTSGATAFTVQLDGGAGDVILQARWLAALRATGAAVWLVMDRPELTRVLAPLVTGIVRDRRDALASATTFPRLDYGPEQLPPPPMPYLAAPAGPVPERLRVRGDGLRVAICWATDRSVLRSSPLAAWAPVLAVPGVTCVSVQVGGGAPPASVADFGARVQDFADTATVLAQVDLVLTIDTSVAHLAGAMGLPTWVLLARDELAAPPGWIGPWEFHSLIDEYWDVTPEAPDVTPYYPSMRFVRQLQPGDWAGVLGRVAAELTPLVRRAA